MKQDKWFWRNFWKGFRIGLLLAAMAALLIWGMAVAGERTRAMGFGDNRPMLDLVKTDSEITVYCFEKEYHVPM